MLDSAGCGRIRIAPHGATAVLHNGGGTPRRLQSAPVPDADKTPALAQMRDTGDLRKPARGPQGVRDSVFSLNGKSPISAWKAEYEAALRGNHVACLPSMFSIRRLAMPLIRHGLQGTPLPFPRRWSGLNSVGAEKEEGKHGKYSGGLQLAYCEQCSRKANIHWNGSLH